MRTGTRALAFALALIVLVALVGCSGGGSSSGGGTTGGGTTGGSTDGGTTGGGTTGGGTTGSTGGTTVVESGFAFDPVSLEVNVGDTVTFTNEDSASHQVLIDGVTLDNQGQGDSVTWTASKAGTFDYICTIHPSMRGSITVK